MARCYICGSEDGKPKDIQIQLGELPNGDPEMVTTQVEVCDPCLAGKPPQEEA